MTVVVALFALALALYSAAHALLYKRDTRAVIAWVAFILAVPIAGSIAYWGLGVNRIHRRASALRPYPAGRRSARAAACEVPDPSLAPLARVGDRVTPFALTAGNSVRLYEDGDSAYPAMLHAIAGAKRSVALAQYIFNVDEVGLEFRDVLAAAVRRGVEVRVLVDAVGAARMYGDSIVELLLQAGVHARYFLPVAWPLQLLSLNLRNHRKLLIVDGELGFTGSMNINVGNRLADPGDAPPMRDVQLELRGPVVRQLQQVFADDWEFAADEHLAGDAWFPALASAGDICARAVPDGPDEHFETVRMILYGALAGASRHVSIATPYFLPDAALVGALNTAALRGATVDIVLPSRSDNRLVRWASQAMYWQLLERGCRIWLSPPPFDHSKLVTVDDAWTLVGSTNWDPRSLRLNFEVNVEVYDAAFAKRARAWFETRRDTARAVTLAEVEGRPLGPRLRDGAARLLAPYL